MKITKKGFSLIQILVAIAITGIFLKAFIEMQISQQKQNKLLSQKLEVTDMKNFLQTTFVNPANCNCLLSGKFFDSTDSNAKISIPLINAGCSSSAPLIVSANQIVPGSQTLLKVNTIELVDIEYTGNTDEYLAKLKIDFAPESLAGPLAPLSIRKRFTTLPTSPNTAKEIDKCLSFSSGTISTTHTYYSPSLTPQHGVKLIDDEPGTLCMLSGMDDDDTAGVSVATVGYYESKCKVRSNGTEWRAWAPLDSTKVMCLFVCFKISN